MKQFLVKNYSTLSLFFRLLAIGFILFHLFELVFAKFYRQTTIYEVGFLVPLMFAFGLYKFVALGNPGLSIRERWIIYGYKLLWMLVGLIVSFVFYLLAIFLVGGLENFSSLFSNNQNSFEGVFTFAILIFGYSVFLPYFLYLFGTDISDWYLRRSKILKQEN